MNYNIFVNFLVLDDAIDRIAYEENVLGLLSPLK
jgi:hypothetical protein